MSDNFNIQQGSNISNKQGGADSGQKLLIIGVISAVIAGLILFYIFGIK